ncbi:hypothetical protein MPER_10059, partial [Moniliophthora perniciosa FA553]
MVQPLRLAKWAYIHTGSQISSALRTRAAHIRRLSLNPTLTSAARTVAAIHKDSSRGRGFWYGPKDADSSLGQAAKPVKKIFHLLHGGWICLPIKKQIRNTERGGTELESESWHTVL